jgi:radical SAM protein with 4Fe4S-binding SPASM domain
MSVSQEQEFFIQWHLTERCNLRCTHCYQTGGRTTELSFDEIRAVAGEVREMLDAWSDAYGLDFSPSFNVTGGEPFLREDFFDVLETLGGCGFEIYVLTNGTLVDRSRARALHDLGVKGVQVSMEGPEEIHEKIRGKGSFGKSIDGIGNLLAEGLTVTLNSTLSKINANHFIDLISLGSSLGVQKVGFSRLVPSGRGAALLGQMLDKADVERIYREIFSLDTGDLRIVTGDPVATQMADPVDSDAGSVAAGGCSAGISGLTFLADGTITPCRRLFIPVGNLRSDRLREVWATSEVLGALRDRSRYKGRCRNCMRWAVCRGCRAIAYAYSQSMGQNDFLADDPQCFIS